MSVSVLAQDEPDFIDKAVLNEFLIPFGDWMKQMVFWVDQNLGGRDPVEVLGIKLDILGLIRWPFDFFMNLIVSEDPSIVSIPWIWTVIGMFLIASFTRNVRVGVMVAVMLTICGMLGPDYWDQTARTIGMIFVSVLLCAIIGIPMGILSGRFDGVWNVVRPTLDGMQVIHSFVYMLPFVFFWGIGEVSATMVTMVFALPPLVRLTNLGIRQVPEDVVEAARSYGSTELKVLTEVQLPLARPAIMTGLNQTLLLAFSMLGIAAIMGAGGLGLLVFRAINNSSVSLAASAGLALFLVAVALDRISQTEDNDGQSLLERIGEAFATRKDPEAMMEAVEARAETKSRVKAEAPVHDFGTRAPLAPRERVGLLTAAAGGLVAIVGVFLTWGNDSGKISGWGRRVDQNLTGDDFDSRVEAGEPASEVQTAFNGLEASGGSWYGYVVIAFAFVGVLWALYNMFTVPEVVSGWLGKLQGWMLGALAFGMLAMAVISIFGDSPGWLPDLVLIAFAVLLVLIAVDAYLLGMQRAGADGIVLLGLGAVAGATSFLFSGVNPLNIEYFNGPGAWVSLIGSLIMVGGALVALTAAPYSPRRPLPIVISWGRVAAAVFAFLLVIAGGFSGWSFDDRNDAVITPEIAEQIQALKDEADAALEASPAAGTVIAARNASQIQNLVNGARQTDQIILDGFVSDGSRLGWQALIFSGLAIFAAIPAAGLLGGGEQRRWQFSAVLGGLGIAVMVVSLGWIASLARVSDPRFVTGAGAFMTSIAGFIAFASSRSVLAEFRRSKVYASTREAALHTDSADHGALLDDADLMDELFVHKN